MEQVGHLQWTLGITFILAGIFSIPITGWDIFLLGWFCHFPDILDLMWGKGFAKHHRYVTHSLFFLLFWYLLAWLIGMKIFWIMAIGCTFHIAEDFLAGGAYIELLSPISNHYGRIMLISQTTQARIGRLVKNYFNSYVIGTESLSDELAYIWLLTMIGSWLFLAGLCIFYLLI
jgi:membrane-bound metal-dependent hydrolase YbcI (DUF457 family)